MGNYIFNYESGYPASNTVIDAVLNKYDLHVVEFVKGEGITSRLKIHGTYNDGNSNLSYLISEFPGNCVGIVISRCEVYLSLEAPEYYKKIRERIIDSSIELARELEYGVVICSGVENRAKNYLKEKGFKFTRTYYNPHSQNKNYFAFYSVKEVK